MGNGLGETTYILVKERSSVFNLEEEDVDVLCYY